MRFFLHKCLIQVEKYARELQHRVAIQDQEPVGAKRAELAQMRDSLQKGFSSVNFDQGLKALRDLVQEYEQIQLLRMKKIRLPSRRLLLPIYESERIEYIHPRVGEADALSTPHIFALVEETYRQGLSVLADALRLTQVVQTSNAPRLDAEIAELEREIDSLRSHEATEARVDIREAIIRSHKRRLESLGLQQLRLDELLYQADSCEACLALTRIELAVLHAGSSEASVSSVTEALQRTIDQAIEVQAKLKSLGF